jgi:hypothetical protein
VRKIPPFIVLTVYVFIGEVRDQLKELCLMRCKLRKEGFSDDLEMLGYADRAYE